MNNSHESISNGALPSLNALRAFEAVVRTGSVTGAAAELCVTQGAVSHQIGQLEDWFGLELVRRRGRGLEPTEVGRELSDRAGPAFAALEEACARILRPRETPLQVAAPGSFLARWLVPRLEELEASFPALRLRLRTDGNVGDLRSRRIDALVVCAANLWPDDLDEVVIAPDRIGPVCASRLVPAMAASPRLATDSQPQAWKEWDRLSGRRPGRVIARRFDHLVPMLEAARAGLGTAVVPELLVLRELHSGELAAPSGFLPSGRRFGLLRLRSRASEAAQVDLASWFSRTEGAPSSPLDAIG